jgi:hypothetical protein
VGPLRAIKARFAPGSIVGRSCSRSGLALEYLGFAARTKGRSALRGPGSRTRGLSHFVSIASGIGALVGVRDRPCAGRWLMRWGWAGTHGTTVAFRGAMAIVAFVSKGIRTYAVRGLRALSTRTLVKRPVPPAACADKTGVVLTLAPNK